MAQMRRPHVLLPPALAWDCQCNSGLVRGAAPPRSTPGETSAQRLSLSTRDAKNYSGASVFDEINSTMGDYYAFYIRILDGMMKT